METTKQQNKRVEGRVRGALDGVKVLEWAQFAAGPFCTKLLAGLGAEVIKIEEPGPGDIARRRGPFLNDVPHPERSAPFLFLNTGKKGITLNLKTATGREVFEKLLKEVDILVEEQPPALVEKLGLGYEHLKEINPQLIVTSISPFGQTGLYRDYKSYYLTDFHGGGLGYPTPFDPLDPTVAEREPIIMGSLSGEYHCGLNAALATTSALYARPMLGTGQHIDISKQETFLNAQRPDVARFLGGNPMATRTGSSMPGGVRANGILRCRDGYFNTHVDENQVPAFFEMMGNPEWSRDEKFSPENLAMHRLDLDLGAQEWAKDHNKEEIWHAGQQRGIPLAPIYSVGEAAESEHLQARGFFAELKHPATGKLKYPAAPFKLSRTPVKFEHPAPLLGEHNEEIYCNRLGYTRDDLVLMRRTGVI